MTAVATVTIRRFGPSGSLNMRNIVREQMRDVMTVMMRGILFVIFYLKVKELESQRLLSWISIFQKYMY